MPLCFIYRFERIYLWMDDDVPGREGASKFAAKLGIKRCFLVPTKDGDPDGPKDANDALRAGKDLNALLAKVMPFLSSFATLLAECYPPLLL